ncbi:RNA polymerase sigma factor [Paenibacillus psychroresistens]|nr:RNA polymerase sigma factor [Paenibacillus psychroresistens]
MNEKDLFENYKKEVYKTCYFMLHNKADAEDVCQEVFISVFQHDWKRVEHLKTWLMRVTVNRCLNHLKKVSRIKEKEVRLQLQPFKPVEKATELVVEEREAAKACVQLLSQLPLKMRAVVSLRFMNELSLNEIADILRIPLGTVKSRLNKGLKHMKIIVDIDEKNQGKDGDRYGQGGGNIYSVSK